METKYAESYVHHLESEFSNILCSFADSVVTDEKAMDIAKILLF